MDNRIVRNLVINLVGLILPTFVSLATVPSYIHVLGVERFGVVALIWVLIDYFSILGLGMSVAAQNRVSKAYASGDADACLEVFWSAAWLNLVAGMAIGIVVYLGGVLYLACCNDSAPDLTHEIVIALPWVAVAVPVANASSVFAAMLSGAERFGAYNTSQTAGTIMFQLVPLCVAWLIAPTLQNMVAAAVVVKLLSAVQLGWLAWRVLGVRGIRRPQFHVVKGLFNFGGWVLVSTVTSMVADSLDRVLIGAALGARVVTYYTVPKNLVTRMNIVSMSLNRTLFPRLSAVSCGPARELTQQSIEFLNSIFTPISIIAMLIVEPFLNIWIGREITPVSAPIARILVIAIWFVGQAEATRILIQSNANPAIAARASAFELPVYVIVLWFAIRYFGLTGAAVANIVRVMLDYVVLLWLSRMPARPIFFNMLAHLTFLVAGLWLASSIRTLSVTFGMGVLLVTGDLMCSLAMSPALRSIGHSLLLRFNPRRDA